MSAIQITSSKLPEVVECPTSKSAANRALIIGSLLTDSIKVEDLPLADDVQDLLIILEEIGIQLKFSSTKTSVKIENSFPECEKISSKPVELSGSEGGTTIRFLIPFLALGKNEYRIPLKGKLAKRPFNEILNLIKSLGGECHIQDGILTIKGGIKLPDKIKIDCSETTQFYSAFGLLRARFKFDLIGENLSFSQKYISLTSLVVKEIKDKKEYQVPVDFSSLGYFIAYGVINQSLRISNVKKLDHSQADTKFFDILKNLDIEFNLNSNDGLYIYKTKNFQGFKLDCSECIDLVPTLAYLASFAKSESNFFQVSPLRYKECDRLDEIIKLLTFFGIKVEYFPKKDLLRVFPDMGKSQLNQYDLVTENDHRMVMVGSLFLKSLGGGSISPREAVTKSFPQFFKYFS